VARHLVLVPLAHALVAHDPQLVGDGVVVGGDDPTLTGGEVLRAVEGEAAQTEGSGALPADGRAVRLGGVLDQREAVAGGRVGDAGHVRALAVEVHRDQGRGPLADGRLHGVRVDVEVVLADVGEPGGRARLEDRVDRRDERERARDHFVARLQVQRLQRGHQSGRAVVDGDRVTHPDQFGEGPFEAFHHGALGDHSGSDDLDHETLDLGIEAYGRNGNHEAALHVE
jgi:hypothetical protein